MSGEGNKGKEEEEGRKRKCWKRGTGRPETGKKERKPLKELMKPVNLSDSEDSLDSVDVQRAEAILDKELGKKVITGGNYPMLEEILPDEEIDLMLDGEKKEKGKNERKIKIKADIHPRPKVHKEEPYTPTRPSISDASGKPPLKLKSPTYIPTLIGSSDKPVTIEEIVPARDLEEATAHFDPTLFGPMKKLISPLREDCPPAGDEKEEERMKNNKEEDKKDKKFTEVEKEQSEGRKWNLIRIEPEKTREEWLSGSIRFRMGTWLDEFFYLTAPLHGHLRDIRCNRCNEAEKTILAGVSGSRTSASSICL